MRSIRGLRVEFDIFDLFDSLNSILYSKSRYTMAKNLCFCLFLTPDSGEGLCLNLQSQLN